MRRRPNPWPSFVDLFSATLIATFAGMIMITSAYQQELKVYQAKEEEVRLVRAGVQQARVEADNIINQVKQSLDKNTEMKPITRKCGDDTCIDLFIHFAENGSDITDLAELKAVQTTCATLKSALDSIPVERRKDIEIIIEGHTDDRQPESFTDPRAKYLYNWNLSAGRATSVSYEFKQCGVDPADYQIVAIGYANSMPQCFEDTDECRSRNRRTTLRLRGDTKRIEERLKGVVKAGSAITVEQ